MAQKKSGKCAHPGCNCPAAPGSTYCEGSAKPTVDRVQLPACGMWHRRSGKHCRISVEGCEIRTATSLRFRVVGRWR